MTELAANAIVLGYGDYLQQIRPLVRTLSWDVRPGRDELARQYCCHSGPFLDTDTYPVRFTDPSGRELRDWNDADAQPIRFRDFVRHAVFRDSVLEGWYCPAMGPIRRAAVIAMHCAGCDRRVVIDGVHRLTWLAAYGSGNELLEVTELSGCRWPGHTPDMNVVCRCP